MVRARVTVSVSRGRRPLTDSAAADSALRLRLSLGHELAEAGWLLPGFVAYLDAHGSPTVTIEVALAWAQQAPKSPAGRVTTVGPRRMTAAQIGRAHV